MRLRHLPTNPCFLELVRLLDEPVPQVLGYLVLLKITGYRRSPEVFDSVEQVEACAHWTGEPGRLVEALLGTDFLREQLADSDVYELLDPTAFRFYEPPGRSAAPATDCGAAGQGDE